MSGGTPIVPNGEARLDLAVAGLTHVLRLRVGLFNPGGPAPYLFNLFGGGTINAEDAVDQFDALVGQFYHAGAVFGSWTLFQRVGAGYIPITSYPSDATGTNTLGNQPASELTMVFRDSLNRLQKVILLESAFQAPQKEAGTPFLGANVLMDDIANTGAGHIGSWVQGRGGLPPTREISAVVSLNRKIRRARGLV